MNISLKAYKHNFTVTLGVVAGVLDYYARDRGLILGQVKFYMYMHHLTTLEYDHSHIQLCKVVFIDLHKTVIQ